MTYDKAIALLHSQFPQNQRLPNIELSENTIHQIFQALYRLKGIERITVHNDGLVHSPNHTLWVTPNNEGWDFWKDYDKL